ncbi:alpha/beta fold hydrolase [Streptomyces albipurpureus]|uniref:Alpha/beta fold hydrolase n=1 Tax=Streptomyces albipurpureus TaxID=2897419 RepID=A0ABT0UUN1_9ACTN|nr:alpha/beta fold hydrolase [Streptomyces sp. CWNU-1]MCM2392175.1 alpha/beta fold hydrolase [Streptomyces sp. CWNU-1]
MNSLPTAPVDDEGRLAHDIAGEGPAVVLLHGGLLDLTVWDEEFEVLAADYQVIRYDARGHGRSSSVTGDWSPAEDLHALLSHLCVERARLVGASLGARTALDFALLYPELTESLVLAAPGISGRPFVDPYVIQRTAAQVKAVTRADGGELFVEEFLRLWVDGPHRLPEEVEPALRGRMRTTVAANVRAHSGGLGTGRPREVGAAGRLHEISVPVLALLGDLDSSDIEGNVEALADAVPHTRVARLSGAGHMVNLEAPEAFLKEVTAFLAG